MRARIGMQAETEIIRFLTDQPSPEQIIAFHPSSEVTERFYEMIDTERERELSEGEQQELETYLYLEHFLQMLKIEAHRKQQQQAS